jgi:hypothetical protein
MGDEPAPIHVIPRDEIEILPADSADQRPVDGGSETWVSVDARGRSRRVYVLRPGPIGAILLWLALGGILAAALVLALGVFIVFACIAGVLIVGSLLYGYVRALTRRLR